MDYDLTNPSKVLVFGDSWAAGFGLGAEEKSFGEVVANHYTLPLVNKGEAGSSLGHILHTFMSHTRSINKGDIVIIIVPPDIRWYNISPNGFCYSLSSGGAKEKEYKRFLKDKWSPWFIYHHSLFVHTLISICKELNCNIVLAHNHGKLTIDQRFSKLIDTDYFLDKDKSLMSLLGEENWENSYAKQLRQQIVPLPKDNCLFIPDDNHPSEKGHILIAEKIIKKLEGKDV